MVTFTFILIFLGHFILPKGNFYMRRINKPAKVTFSNILDYKWLFPILDKSVSPLNQA